MGHRRARPAWAACVIVAVALAGGRTADAQRPPQWEARVADRVELRPGEQGTLAISLAVDRGLVVSKDAPVIVDLSAAKGVTLRKRRVGRSDAVDPEADAPRFAVPVRADDAGEHVVRVRLRFWICGGKSCRPVDVQRTTKIIAVAPPPAPAPAPAPPPSDAGVTPVPDGR